MAQCGILAQATTDADDLAIAMALQEPSQSQPSATTYGGATTDADDLAMAKALQVEESHAAQAASVIMAMALQEAEVHAAQAASVPVEHQYHNDPVWGEFHLKPGENVTVVQRGCLAFCPCLIIVGCCCCSRPQTDEDRGKQRAWRPFLLSWSFSLSILQVFFLSWMLIGYGGFVDADVNKMLGPHGAALDAMGAKNAAKILYRNEAWRLISPILLHGGVIHLALNMTVQLYTGVLLEVLWGKAEWIVIFIFSGAYASLASCIFSPDSLSVGSSGSQCGLLGGWLIFILITWRQTLPGDRSERNVYVFAIAVTVVIMACLGLLPFVDWAAHGGGFVAGMFLAMVMFAGRLQDLRWRIATGAGGCLLTGFLFGGSIWYFITHVVPDERLLHLCLPPDC